ncbi:hypothetical protein DL89DRAFT_268323 [Linderina pennispora]|uniref:Uncharacterized protein n=1 Tax=Linderina pennispora TaxID=61395 RepID=A0A1Y1W4K0_9FUNG|nr:uncharacterized protein DL89DRAFT_268323 [Linderina pennispora]ORX68490.1 hypothetical protein DL89DRAFT_268323 [Linderina pennispora]
MTARFHDKGGATPNMEGKPGYKRNGSFSLPSGAQASTSLLLNHILAPREKPVNRLRWVCSCFWQGAQNLDFLPEWKKRQEWSGNENSGPRVPEPDQAWHAPM